MQSHARFTRHLRLVVLFILSLSLLPGAARASRTLSVSSDDGDVRSQSGLAALATSADSSPFRAPEPTENVFVANTGGQLDQYLYRRNTPDGRLRFNINIDRYYSSLISPSNVDSQGFLKAEILQQLIDEHLLPSTAYLTLAVYDVDQDASPCAELDYVEVNGRRVQTQLGFATLSSGSDQWDRLTFPVPLSQLKLPTESGVENQRPAALNEIGIEIDSLLCNAWAVEVDWAAITIGSLDIVPPTYPPYHPILFVHGWTGDRNTFNTFKEYTTNAHIPYAVVDLERGILPIPDSAALLKAAISTLTQQFGVDQVDIFAHSKGGVVARVALQDDEVAPKVAHLISFGSPHHGQDWTPAIAAVTNCTDTNFPGYEDQQQCKTAAEEMTVASIRDNINFHGCQLLAPEVAVWIGCTPLFVQQPSVEYRSLLGGPLDVGKTATYPWLSSAWLDSHQPFPLSSNVDAEFPWYDHSQIKQERDSYDCAMSFIDSQRFARTNCLGGTSNTQASTSASTTINVTTESTTDRPIWMAGLELYQPILTMAETLQANTSKTVPTYLEASPLAILSIVSDVPLTFNLIDPSGRVVDPAIATTDPAIVYVEQPDAGFGNGWLYQYQVQNPAPGLWQQVIQSTNTVHFGALSAVDSPVRLQSNPDRFTYRPGELVTLSAYLIDGTTLQSGAIVTGTVTLPDDTSFNQAFYDDGTHGDSAAGDGQYTAQFTAPNTHGYVTVDIIAIRGNLRRVDQATLSIAAQTAQFQGVTSETIIDADGDGLYDALNLGIGLTTSTNGHFEIMGTLVDGTGQPITSGYYATRLAGVDPLTAGNHTIVLSFNGEAIRKSAKNGPYTLTNLRISDQTDGSFEVDWDTNVYTTGAYQARQFEGPLFNVTGGSESVTDTNGNGLYDWLNIQLNLDVAFPGEYHWSGRLLDPNGVEIGWADGTGWLDGQTPMTFSFPGSRIRSKGGDGRYSLSDVSVYQTSGGTATASFVKAYITAVYNHLAFEGTAGSPPPTVSFTAVADARVKQESPTSNYGTSIKLDVDGSSGKQVESYLRFNVSGVSGSVQRATLRLYATTNGTTNGPAVYAAGNTWTETGITWNNRPALVSGASDNRGAISPNTWVEFDVTPLVIGNASYSFALVGDSSDGVEFSSREGSAPPQLIVTVTPTPPPSYRTIVTEADALVKQVSPTINYGTSSSLDADGSSGKNVESYLRFTISGVSGTIQRATLRLYATDNTTNGPAVYGASATWTETEVTWNNRPGPIGNSIENKLAISANTWVEYDVTSLITGNGTYNLVLMPDSSDGVTFSSREGSAPPQLVLMIGS